MPDQPETPATAVETPAGPAVNDPIHLPDDHPLVKTLAAQKEQLRALKEENQALAPKAQQFDALEEANKTELQKAQDALTQANQRAEAAEAARLRSDIARTKNVPVELLTAGDEKSLNAQAEALLAFRGEQTPAAPSSSGPTPSGAAPLESFTDAQIAAMTPEEYAAKKDAIYRARDAGRITL